MNKEALMIFFSSFTQGGSIIPVFTVDYLEIGLDLCVYPQFTLPVPKYLLGIED